jgi:hypothetical protein
MLPELNFLYVQLWWRQLRLCWWHVQIGTTFIDTTSTFCYICANVPRNPLDFRDPTNTIHLHSLHTPLSNATTVYLYLVRHSPRNSEIRDITERVFTQWRLTECFPFLPVCFTVHSDSSFSLGTHSETDWHLFNNCSMTVSLDWLMPAQ